MPGAMLSIFLRTRMYAGRVQQVQLRSKRCYRLCGVPKLMKNIAYFIQFLVEFATTFQCNSAPHFNNESRRTQEIITKYYLEVNPYYKNETASMF
jgi:hypothetical protein